MNNGHPSFQRGVVIFAAVEERRRPLSGALVFLDHGVEIIQGRAVTFVPYTAILYIKKVDED